MISATPQMLRVPAEATASTIYVQSTLKPLPGTEKADRAFDLMLVKDDGDEIQLAHNIIKLDEALELERALETFYGLSRADL